MNNNAKGMKVKHSTELEEGLGFTTGGCQSAMAPFSYDRPLNPCFAIIQPSGAAENRPLQFVDERPHTRLYIETVNIWTQCRDCWAWRVGYQSKGHQLARDLRPGDRGNVAWLQEMTEFMGAQTLHNQYRCAYRLSRENFTLAIPHSFVGKILANDEGMFKYQHNGTKQWSLSQAATVTEGHREEFVRRIMETHQRRMPPAIGEILDFVTKRNQIQPAIFC
jgi:hypothetical protein